jgi:TetR/AcrR family transcriptional repressor of nem operon
MRDQRTVPGEIVGIIVAQPLGRLLGLDVTGSEQRARAISAAVAGAQLVARSRSDISVFDALIDSYRKCGLLPA